MRIWIERLRGTGGCLGTVKRFRVEPGQDEHAVPPDLLYPRGKHPRLAQHAGTAAVGANQFDVWADLPETTGFGIATFTSTTRACAVQRFYPLDGSVGAKQRPDAKHPEGGRRVHVSSR